MVCPECREIDMLSIGGRSGFALVVITWKGGLKMVRNHGAVSLAFMRGERKINVDRRRTTFIKKVDLSKLTPEQDAAVREEARLTGDSFQECAARFVSGQKRLKDYKEVGK